MAKARKQASRPIPTGRDIPRAVEAPSPQRLSPQLATLVDTVPVLGEWIYEIKLDGYRLLTRFDKGKARLFTRNGHDWSAKMPRLVAELETLKLRSGWLDGEIVVPDESGVPDFNALQNALDQKNSAGIVYYLFDVPFFEGYDLRLARLAHRRQLLEALLGDRTTEHVRLSQAFEGDPASILNSACKMRLEGILAKRADAPYVSRRSEYWLKLKCKQRQEFVVVGYTDRANTTTEIGSLILAVYKEGELVPVGSVGTGWSSNTASELKEQLAKIERDSPPFTGEVKKPGRWSKRKPGQERWVEPQFVAEVEFSEWTPDGQIRHPSFISLRTDSAPSAI